MTLRLAVIQHEARPVDSFADFAAQCRAEVQVAAGYGADVALFPEMLTNQLLSLHPGEPLRRAVRTLSRYTEAYQALFADLAVGFGVHIAAGSHFTQIGESAYNIAYFFGLDGQVGRQYKLHVTPTERHTWGIEAGDRVEVLQTDAGPLAIQICYDIEFPEPTRVAVAAGARVVLVPYCTDDRQGHLRVRRCAEARCIENQIYAATAGVVGHLRHVREMDVHYAQSAILTPSDFGFPRDGIAGECEPGQPAVLVQDLDLERLETARARGTVRNWADRRTDLYEIVWKPR
jgi:predicted amidohydrolase